MKAVAAVALAALLAGCSIGMPTLFRVPVLQGNVVDAEKVAQLEIGMTPRQVQYLLGTPLIDNSFSDHRWAYVFYFRDRNGRVNKSQLSLLFEDQQLAHIEGDQTYRAVLPEEAGELDPEELEAAVADEEEAESPPPPDRPLPQPDPAGPEPGTY
jgi:outer membrane protein assembly factor BamE